METVQDWRRFPWNANRASAWQLRTRSLAFTSRPLLMGIVNVTPDSFSDGGHFFDSSRAVDRALELVAAGAAVIDVGGESTRPYSTVVSGDEELRRVQPVIQSLCRQTTVPVSIDTSKPAVARAALDAGAEIINDVTGMANPEMQDVARQSKAGACVMHMQGTPQTMQDDPHYDDVAADILTFLTERSATLLKAGVDRERICLDPGIGFGKTHEHNVQLMQNCWRFHVSGFPLLVGHSRKGFLGKLLGDKTADRTAATAGAALALALQGVQVIRVHDVRDVHDALVAFSACGGVDKAT